MPQMKPMNWMFLMMYFMSIFILFNILLYFMVPKYKIKLSKGEKDLFINYMLMW